MTTIQVPLSGGRTYPVLVGQGVTSQIEKFLPFDAQRAAVVTQPGIGVSVDLNVDCKIFNIANGESAKTLTSIEDLCRSFVDWGLTRDDVIIGVGGGVVTDVAGFAASIYHRGIAVVHVATTLLAQIDAAIGGKTGVNLPEGKNLVGSFWQPASVLCDTENLSTLPEAEMRNGFGEMAKYHFLSGEKFDHLDLEERIARCVEIKASVVAADEKDTGGRAVLNYGHTLGHALEVAKGFDIRHGEAVAIGLVYAAELAYNLERIDHERVLEHRQVIESYGLPSALPVSMSDEDLLFAMTRDKKAVEGFTFVLDGPNGLEIVKDIEEILVRETLKKVR